MRRRALLASLATGSAALAGCAFASSPGESPPTDAEPDERGDHPSTDPTTDPGSTSTDALDDLDLPAGRTSVIELETVPRTYSLVPTSLRLDDVRIALGFDRTATAEAPARLRGLLENHREYAVTVELDELPVLGSPRGSQPPGEDGEAALHVVPTAANEIATATPDVSRTAEGLWVSRSTDSDGPERVELDPGERRRFEYLLVGQPRTPGRPTGTYEFRGHDATVAVHVWDTDSPGPDGTSRFEDRTVPSLQDDAESVWFHEADDGTPGYLEPERERAELDGAVGFEVVNHSHESVGCGHWNLHKLVDGEWFHLGPWIHTSDCRRLAPGESMSWTLRAFNGEAVRCGACTDGVGCATGLTRGFLGGGEYAVVAGYAHPADRSAALVELVGEPVEVVPTSDATIERDGGTVTVTDSQYGDGERPSDAVFELVRVDDADDRIVAEQVMYDGLEGPAAGGAGSPAARGSALRNAIAAMGGQVDRVVVRSDDTRVDWALGYDDERRRFRFRGQAYEAWRVDLEA